MSNQWGRNNQQARSDGRSSGVLLPAVLCLMLMGAGAYLWFARQTSQAEIDRLDARIASLTSELDVQASATDKAVEALAQARRTSGRGVEKLEQDYSDLTLNEIPKLNRLLDERDVEIAALEKQLDAQKSSAKTAAKAAASATTDVSNALSEAKTTIAALRRQVDGLKVEKSALQKRLDGLGSIAAASDDDRTKQLRETENQLSEAKRALAEEKASLEKTHATEISALERRLKDETAKVADLEKRLANETLTDTPQPADTPLDRPVGNARDGAVVEAVLATTRGLGLLDDEKTQQLRHKLVAGACVTDALESVFDKVPLILMRNLMRDLKSDC